jgi:hypothetical protein
MTKRSAKRTSDEPRASGTGGFVGQVGLFETANGLPHGPMAIVLAVAAALVIIPVSRIARLITRR